MSTLVNCPNCKKEVIWNNESINRPFCSERCRLQDLGAWFMEEHVINGDQTETNLEFDQLNANEHDVN